MEHDLALVFVAVGARGEQHCRAVPVVEHGDGHGHHAVFDRGAVGVDDADVAEAATGSIEVDVHREPGGFCDRGVRHVMPFR